MKRVLVALLALVLVVLGFAPAAAKTPAGPSALAVEPAVDAHLGYQYQKTCSPSAKPGTKALLNLLIKTWGGSSWGISRSCGVGGISEHKEGRALDWHKDVKHASHRKAVADAMKWLTSNNGEVAYRLGIMYIIWDQKIWSIYYQELGWRKMANRGSRTANHKDHVHISLSWDGAMRQTSWWTGVPVTKPLNSACGVKGARACLPVIKRASKAWSWPGTVVPPFLPAPWTKPNIGGSPQVGRTLTAVPGTWVPKGASVTYAWLADNKVIPKATGQTFVVQAAQLGKAIKVRVTATPTGGIPVTKTSDGMTDAVRGKFQVTSRSRLEGIPQTGQVLSVVHTVWEPAATSWSYTWRRNDKAIKGATKATYTLKAADVGKKISVSVTGRAAGINAATRRSFTVVAKSGALTTLEPTIRGDAVVGHTLTAIRGVWGPGTVSYAYQWYRDGKAINKATKKTYKLTKADLGTTITVRVRGKKSGYATTDLVSTPSGPVLATLPPSEPTAPTVPPESPPAESPAPAEGTPSAETTPA